MRRREFITLLGGAAVAWPLAARAQQGDRVRLLAAIMGGRNGDTDPEGRAWFAAFRQGLQELGWVEGRNFRADYRWPSGDLDRMRAIAKEFVDLKPDVIFAGNTPSVEALLRETRTIPIVFTNLSDPVGTGLIESLARPGGNATGFTAYEYSLAGKWLEMLKEIAPAVTRVVVLFNPEAAPFAQPKLHQDVRAGIRRDGQCCIGSQHQRDGSGDRGTGACARRRSGSAPGHLHLLQSCAPHRTGGTPPSPGHLPDPWPSHRRRLAVLWARHGRSLPARCGICRSHPQGREASRSAGAEPEQVRTDGQPQDRQGARAYDPGQGHGARRRGDRMMKRREFITFIGGSAAAWPLAARAQQGDRRRIAMLSGLAASDPEA